MKDNFYKAFEAHNRGSRKSIKKRLEIYLPFILPLHTQYPEGMVLDIGCGRGEWLELMQENSIHAKGVDLDEGMLLEGKSLNLDMERRDGIEFLRQRKEKSAIAITAFHVVEHIPFEALQNLIQEALRVLKPGGVLILETPNPENIRVAGEFFYIDPTHQKPIPSQLLSFLPEYYGFSRTKVLRVNENEYLQVQQYASLHQVLEGVSQDYAIVAQKTAKPQLISLLDPVFNKEYGQSLQTILEKFERRMLRYEELVESVVEKSDLTIDKAEESAWKAETILQTLDDKLNELKARIDKTQHYADQAQHEALKARQSADTVWQHYQHVVNSRSWKITKPLRILAHTYRKIKTLTKQKIKHLLIKIKYKLDAYPTVKTKLINMLNRFPTLRSKLKHIIIAEHISHQETNASLHIKGPKLFIPDEETIFDDFKKALSKQRNIK